MWSSEFVTGRVLIVVLRQKKLFSASFTGLLKLHSFALEGRPRAAAQVRRRLSSDTPHLPAGPYPHFKCVTIRLVTANSQVPCKSGYKGRKSGQRQRRSAFANLRYKKICARVAQIFLVGLDPQTAFQPSRAPTFDTHRTQRVDASVSARPNPW